MKNYEDSPSLYYSVIRNYQEAQLLFTAIRLNIFSYLDEPIEAKDIAEKLNCAPEKIELLMMALASIGLIQKNDNLYLNTEGTKKFLSRNSDVYIGETILFREKMTSLDTLEQKLTSTWNIENSSYDFEELARVTVPEMYAGRVQSFISEAKKLYPDPYRPLRVLDLGGGTGILSIEFVKCFPKSKAVVFETPEVAGITNVYIKQHQLGSRVEVLSGNFNTDDLGGTYDFIIASGVLNFVTGDISQFIKKLSASLFDGGYLLVIGQFAEHEYNVPPNMVSWLSGFLNGIPLPPNNEALYNSMKENGLQATNTLNDTLFQGQLYRKEEKTVIQADDVIHSFIELTERIANSKTNVLDFGSEDMTFYRGEIHIIKMIGDFPGIHSAELARKFGITRPVVHKTLQKLSDRGLIKKEPDDNDKKLYHLYLTDKGQTAYRCHAEYHEKYDKALFSLLFNMNDEQLLSIKGFLDHAITLIQTHA